MVRSIQAEILKLRTTRAIYELLLGAVAVVLLSTVSTIASAKADSLSGPLHEQVFFLLVSINVGLFSLLVGTRVPTDELRHSTIAHAFLSDPKRRTTLFAKGAVAALVASIFAIVCAAAMVGAALPLAAAKGGTLSPTNSDVGAVAGFVLANALWGVIGVGVGFVVRHQVAAIVGGIIWILAIENLGSGFLGDAGAYLPGQSAYALAQALDGTEALDVGTAAAVMIAYAVVIFSIGVVVTRRRDVL